MTTFLAGLDVLALDCQATAPDPSKGHLLEIGWSDVRASSPSSRVEAELVQLPEGAEIPRQVRRVTGLDEAALADGVAPEKVWPCVVETARSIASRNQTTHCPTIIHFSRFEEPYVRWLDARTGASFPLTVVCTHEIVRRLLPALPRRGLRAVAGYFGHSVAEMRRASHHVSATAAVWRAAVSLLEHNAGVRTLDELTAWLKTPLTRAKRRRTYPMTASKRRDLPDRPGVYRMLRANGDVLYVGKATSLKKRVTSYFRERAPHAEHILEMLSQARELELTVTGSALEAALEEADTIKRLSPPYNKALRRNERSVVFATPALDDVADAPDAAHRLGPLAGGDLWPAVSSLARDGTNATPAEALAVPASYAPQESTYRSGGELFRAGLGTQSLLARGAALWLDDRDDDSEEEFELVMQYDVDAERWTPERVQRRLDDLVKRASHLVRRGHWLCLLCESTLIWETPDGEEVALAIQDGRLHSRTTNGVTTSPRSRKSFDERRECFNLDTYDRLTVLTKEIRRLIGEQRPVRLLVHPDVVLDSAKLRAMLQWI